MDLTVTRIYVGGDVCILYNIHTYIVYMWVGMCVYCI